MFHNISKKELFAYIKRQLAMDADLDDDGWVTNENGQHYHIDDATGEIDAGMGGKFNGMTPEEAKESTKSESKPSGKTPSVPLHEGIVPMPREQWPDHIKKLGVPPAWTNVHINPDPDGKMQVWGLDKKGRPQKVYSQQFVKQQQAAKFDRVVALDKRIADGDLKSIMDAMRNGTQRQKDTVDCLMAIERMGLRPSSERDTGADKEARGATTLRGEDVVVDGDDVRLKFTGKKGVSLDLSVPDDLKQMFIERKEKAGNDGQLFSCNDRDLNEVMHKVGGKTKDLRTRLAMNLAKELLADMQPAVDEKEFKKMQNAVGDFVSQHLGNTRAVALSSYIPPFVFDNWRPKNG